LRNNCSGFELLNLQGCATEGSFSIKEKCAQRWWEIANLGENYSIFWDEPSRKSFPQRGLGHTGRSVISKCEI
jgi:hypothetical protein